MQIYGDKIFNQPSDKIIAFDRVSFIKAFELIENYKKQGKYLLGYIRYEAKNIFAGEDYKSEKPVLYFEVFDSYKKYEPVMRSTGFYPVVNPLISKEQYIQDINKIKNYISEGITYEVNYTYPAEVKTNYDSLELYETLLANQKTPYNAYIRNEYETLLSFSPELFFRIDGNKITTKPMKGTIKRGKTEQEDRANIEFLKNDEKNRAENVMIVDLLRNDLSKIAERGSVKVEELFGIETHKTLHQMTSTISAIIKTGTTLYDIFESIFPCGSITGAPKISTMRVIDELEPYERGIYCGAIGFISPSETVFSVPIRILAGEGVCSGPEQTNRYICHAGGAIVWDSDPVDEWEETLTKRKFLYSVPEFNLIETMRVENGEIMFFREHLQRMKTSAEILGFAFPEKLYEIKPEKNGIIRIALSKTGDVNISYRELKPNLTNKIRFSDIVIDSSNFLICHKTDFRPYYDKSTELIRTGKIYDEIFVNERGEVTEGSRTNIVIEKGGKLYTPPVSSGLLNGVYRQSMNLEEKILYSEDILNAERIFCINSVRGVVEVEIC